MPKKNISEEQKLFSAFQKAKRSDDPNAMERFEALLKKSRDDADRQSQTSRRLQIQKEKKEEAQRLKRRERAKIRRAKAFYVRVDARVEVIFHHYNRKTKKTTIRDTNELVETFFFLIRSAKKTISDEELEQLIKERLLKNGSEYAEYRFKEILKKDFIDTKLIDKERKKYAGPNDMYLFGAHVNFSWIPDVKFDDDGKCVYTALGYLKRAPRIFKKPAELLKLFQKYADDDSARDESEYVVLTLTSGVKSSWIHRLCVEFDVTHFALDFDYTVALKNISKNGNYNPVCYIRHDSHCYFIVDKKFVNKLSQSRSNFDQHIAVRMLREEKETEAIDKQIKEDIPAEQLAELKDCLVIYQSHNIENLLMDLLKLERTIYKNSSRNNKVVCIEYKNGVTLMVDPNYALGLKLSDGKPVTWKTVQEICTKYKTPFTNQSFPSFVQNRVASILKPPRVQIRKEDKKAIRERQNCKCNLCDRKLTQVEYDHIIPIATGGCQEPENVQALCPECHFNKTKDEQDQGDYYHLPNHASTFNKVGFNVITSKEFERYAFIKKLEESPTVHKAFYLDICKTRRNILLHMAEMGCKIPVYTVMDKPELFVQPVQAEQEHSEFLKDEPPKGINVNLKPGFYFVVSDNHFPLRHNGWYSHFLVDFCLKEGIIQPTDIRFQFVASLTLEDDYFTKAIKDLITLPDALGKHGPNVYVGLMNRVHQTINKTFYTSSLAEASYEFMRHETNDMFIERAPHDLYKVTSSQTIAPDYNTSIIYHLILDIEALELYKMKQIIEEHNGHVTFLNTDCCEFWINGIKANSKVTDPIILSKYFWDKAKTIPKYKYEIKDEPPKYERNPNFNHDKVYHLEEKTWTVQADPGTNDFVPTARQIIDSGMSINIDGIAGAGKTTMIRTITKLLDEDKKKYAILTPTNKASRVISKDAMTIHRFIGSCFFDTKNLKRKLEGLDTIIIDEISMVREVFYAILLTMKKIKPTLKFIICGDFNQLEVVDDRADFDYKNSEALRELCDGQRITLTQCRRSDRALFDLSLRPDEIDPSTLGHEEHQVALCFTNKKRIEINAHWMNQPRRGRQGRSRVLKKLEYDPNSQDVTLFKGLPIIARVNNRENDIANNETFNVQSISGTDVTISDGTDTKVIPIGIFQRLFFPAFAITCHKAQGTSIDRPFTIYEWEKFSTRMKYVAITRSTKLQYVNIV